MFSCCWLPQGTNRTRWTSAISAFHQYSRRQNITPSPSGWKFSQKQCSFSEHLLCFYEWRVRKFYKILEFQDIFLFGLRKKTLENMTPYPPHPSKTERRKEIWKSELFFSTTKIIFIIEWGLHVVLWRQNLLLISLTWVSNSETSHCWMIFLLNAYYAVWNLKDLNHTFCC